MKYCKRCKKPIAYNLREKRIKLESTKIAVKNKCFDLCDNCYLKEKVNRIY